MIVVVGLGAIGSVYAVALKKAGFEVKVALDKVRLDKYADNNLIFNDVECDLDYFTPATSDQPAELIIIATKGVGYEDALNLIEPIVGESTIILPLLNGITSEEIAAQKYGWNRVVYGYFIGHTATRIGRKVYQDGSYRTVFGDEVNDPNNLSNRVLRVKNIFDKAQIHYRIDDDMRSSLWQKFVINIGLNQATAYFRKNYGDIKQDATNQDFMSNLMLEAQSVAIALKIKGSENFAKIGLDTLNKMQGSDSSSMLQDVNAGRVTEVDMFAGEVCALGKKLHIETPYNKLVLKQLISSI